MSVSQILDSNGKIPLSIIEANGGATPTINEVLTAGDDCQELSINNIGELRLSDGAGVPAVVSLKSIVTPGGAAGEQCFNVLSTAGNPTDLLAGRLLLTGTGNIRASTSAGDRPDGTATQLLNLNSQTNGTAGIVCDSLAVQYLGVQGPNNAVRYTQALDAGGVGAAPVGRLSVWIGTPGVQYYLPVFEAAP